MPKLSISDIHAETEDAPAWVDEVIQFWFVEVGQAHWFNKNEVVDSQIRDRFLTLHQTLAARESIGATAPRAILAAVIVLDQFSRNLFRNDPRAYSSDSIARRLARAAIAQGFDGAMQSEQRYFIYLPFEHSENREDQALAVELIQQLGDENLTDFAAAHKAIIDRFGRFPHRNAVLNRASTPDEIAFLKETASSF